VSLLLREFAKFFRRRFHRVTVVGLCEQFAGIKQPGMIHVFGEAHFCVSGDGIVQIFFFGAEPVDYRCAESSIVRVFAVSF
jgi:hypothetical protein